MSDSENTPDLEEEIDNLLEDIEDNFVEIGNSEDMLDEEWTNTLLSKVARLDELGGPKERIYFFTAQLAFLGEKDYAKAAEYYTRYIDLTSTGNENVDFDENILTNRVICLFNSKQYEKVLLDTQVLMRKVNHGLSYLGLDYFYQTHARALAALGRVDEAIETMDCILYELPKKAYRCYSYRAEFKEQRQDFSGAYADYLHALHLETTEDYFLDRLIKLSSKLDTPSNTLKYIERYFTVYGSDDGYLWKLEHLQAYIDRGHWHLSQNDKENARIYFQKALENNVSGAAEALQQL